MGSLGNIFIKFQADVSDISKGVKSVDSSLQDFKKNAESIGKSLKFVELTQGLNVLKTAFDAISGIAGDLINEFDTDAKASAKLTQALQGNTGAAKELLSQASKLQNTRLFPDEVTANADALLATMGFQKDAIQELIPKIQDFASAWGLDLDDAAKKVGKSIVEGGDALKKYGVIVKEGSTVAERFTNINNALSRSFDGQAEAAARAGSGPLQILSQQFGEIKEKAGESLLAFVNVFLPDASSGVLKLTSYMEGLPEVSKRIAEQIHPIVSLVGLLVSTIEKGQQLVDKIGLGKAKETPRISGRGSAGISGSPELDAIAQEKIASDLAKKRIEDNLKHIQGLLKGAGGGKGKEDNSNYINPIIQKIKNDADEVNKIFDQLEPKIISYNTKLANIFNDRSRNANNVLRGGDISDVPLTFDRGIFKQFAELKQDATDIQPIIDSAFGRLTKGSVTATERIQSLNSSLSNIITSGLGSEFTALGEQIGAAFSGDKFDFKALLVPLADVLIQVGQLAIATGIAVAGIKAALESLNPFVAIAAGIALIALGTVVKSSLTKKANKFGEGVLSYGEHVGIIGDNPNARFDPEVTAPSSKLKSLFENVTLPKFANLIPKTFNTSAVERQSINLDGTFRIEGKDLVLAFDRQRAVQLRQTGR